MTDDSFQFSGESLIGPARNLFAITPDDLVEMPRATKAIYIGTGGDLTLRALDSLEDVTLRNIADGTVLAVRIKAVRATGTTASDLVGLA